MTVPSRSELFARVLIACRDHHLPEPASISFAGPHLASMFVDNPYAANEWMAYFSSGAIVRDFYGWNIHLYARDLLVPMGDEVRAVVDDAVSGYETPAESFEPAPVVVFAPPTPTRFDLVVAAECLVPYVQPTDVDGVCCELISECARPKGHQGDHADMHAHQWANEYPAPYAPTHRTVTP